MIDALVLVLEERLERIPAEIRIHGDRIGAVALEGFERVALGRVADVAALRIEDHRNARDSVRWMYSMVRSS